MQETKLYVGTKLIQAVPMGEHEFMLNFKNQEIQQDQPGYKVTYPDGYISWSPKNAFENAYREVTDSERRLFEK